MNISFARIFPLLLASVALPVQAALITGQINMQVGSAVLNPNVLGAVTSVGGPTSGTVTAVEGSYPAALTGDAVTFKGFNVVLGAQSITSLWSVTDLLAPVGTGFNYTFDLSSITLVFQSSTRLLVDGTGTLRSNNPGLDPTAGLWSFDIVSADGSATNGVFSFQSNNVGINKPGDAVATPDGGSSAVLLGVALMAMVGLSRRFKRSIQG